ncbi:Ger(x)C family spore germination protein [Ferviditalea candida]|uniref:Ger(X)C family spore germination protein n=1 Tax=Ferviditalea candida TaxID=3108399 RepID=A0ABU5ZMH8_9BACL|nr:Ger(x)C family spore germination protein [Paenibacillaceae bacterium T2]
MKTVVTFLMLTIGLMPIAGCWSGRELSDSAILVAAAIEKKGNNIKITYQVLDPRKLEKEESEARVVISSEAPTAHEATWRIIKGLKRRLFVSHTKAVIYSTELAKEGKLHALQDAMNRDQQFRLNSYIYVADHPADILGARSPLEAMTGLGLSKGAETVERDLSEMIVVPLWNFMKMSLGPTGSTYTSFLELHKEKEPALTHVDIDGPVIFKKGKLVKTIHSPEITRGILWFENKVEGTSVSLSIPGEPKHKAAIEVHKTSSKITPRFEQGKLVIDVTVQSAGDINEWQSPQALTLPKLKLLEREYKDQIIKEMRGALKKMREDPVTDVLNIGLEVFRQYPDYWSRVHDDWDDLFKKIDVNIKVVAKIQNLGMVKDRRADHPKSDLFPWSK